MFKKLLARLGVGGPSVDTVLSQSTVSPGGTLSGQVHVQGGDHDTQIEYVTLSLVTRVEVEGGDSEHDRTVEFHRVSVTGAFALPAGAAHVIPFSFQVPWETPVTAVYGAHLHGMTMGVRTELSVAKAVDKTDLDPLQIEPLPVQAQILDAFSRLGFRFTRADLESGRIRGLHQTLPFFQEIEFFPSPAYSGRIRQAELTFVTSAQGVDVVLEFDKRGFHSSHDTFGRYHVSHADAAGADWTAVVDGWIRQAVDQHGSAASFHVPAQHGHGFKTHGHGGHGMAGAAAGAAGGFIGGMVAGEVLEEAFDLDMDMDFGDE